MDNTDHNEHGHEAWNDNCNCFECEMKKANAIVKDMPPITRHNCRCVMRPAERAITEEEKQEYLKSMGFGRRAPGIMEWKGLNYFIGGQVAESDTYAMSLILKSIYRSNESENINKCK